MGFKTIKRNKKHNKKQNGASISKKMKIENELEELEFEVQESGDDVISGEELSDIDEENEESDNDENLDDEDEDGDNDENLNDEEEEEDEEEDKSVDKKSSKKKLTKEEIEKIKENTKKRKLQKELREKRRKSENKVYELSSNAKLIWEQVRREDCPAGKRVSLLNELLKLIKGHIKQIIRSHDLVRVIQFIIASGEERHRTLVYNELKDIIIELCNTKYGKFFVLKMLKYGTKEQKAEIIKSFSGHVTKLLLNSDGSNVLETAYSEFANRSQRASLVQECFSNEYKLNKDASFDTLADALKDKSESQRATILEAFKDYLIKLTTKNSIKLSITHFLLREFFKNATLQSKQDLIECLQESVAEILHTKDGSRVALECIWYSNVKQRKFLIKSFKKFVPTIATDEYGHLVLLAIFDCIDDTVLIDKFILNELFNIEIIMDLIKNKHGIKVFEYLLSPRDSKFFHKDIVAILARGDENTISKKDAKTRQLELKKAVLPKFYNLVVTKCKELLFTGSRCLLLINILTNDFDDELKVTSEGANKLDAIKAYIKAISDEGVYQNETNHIIERDASNFSIKKILKGNAENCKLFVDKIPIPVLLSYVGCNRGCFVLLYLLESNDDYVVDKVQNALIGMNNKLKQKEYKGAHLLLNHLKKEPETKQSIEPETNDKKTKSMIPKIIK